ncbi:MULTISPECIES: TetR family transcriptional regulator [Rhodomicrobium]|uniref:TetR family transcriptional regulator n=1 Tax=Rhodomicrobium TaxID=1068 RepID=UPI001AECDE8E|nr:MULTISPECIES: TetR family transcriptional regulator [Rhodomicrobium]
MNSADTANPPSSDTRANAREQLLAAASDLMRERDSLDISLIDLARRAQVNSALVKYYFGNKHGLLTALLDRDLSMAIEQLRALVARDIPPSQKMRLHLAGLVKMYFRFPYLNRLLMATIRDGTKERGETIASRFLAPIYEAYATLLAEGVALGEFRPVDPKFFYFTVIGACDQIFSARAVLRFVHGAGEVDDDLRRAYTQHTTEMIMAGLAAPGVPAMASPLA